eukprot:Sdes_comp20995_c0_seq1m19719
MIHQEEQEGAETRKDEVEEEEEEILQSLQEKHRAEMKKLKNEIMALKKAVSKGDKKKKKETDDKILQLTSAVEIRHAKEISEAQEQLSASGPPFADNKDSNTKLNSLETSPNGEETQHSLELSKAQRRREKKETQAKEKRKEIEEETKDLPRLGDLEWMQINQQLENLKLSVHPIPPDGDCLYNSIAYLMNLRRKPSPKKQVPCKEFSSQSLRNSVADFLKTNQSEYSPFLLSDSEELLTSAQFDEYCENLRNTHAWAGEVELNILSKILETPIHVLQASTKPLQFGNEYLDQNLPLHLSFHRHAFGLGCHYNALISATSAPIDGQASLFTGIQ